jgi:calcineurin-like phosphoesterase family protein
MKIFVISDTHFNHKNIIEYAGRPFNTIEEMNEEIIKRWNSKVAKEDTEFIFSKAQYFLGKSKGILSRLNEKDILKIRKQTEEVIKS